MPWRIFLAFSTAHMREAFFCPGFLFGFLFVGACQGVVRELHRFIWREFRPLLPDSPMSVEIYSFCGLDVVGVLCVELFVTRDGKVLINEIAPRPHNSGHLTIDAHNTCQFEQQVRAICGLPLGDASQHADAAMANILGDLWDDTEPNWSALLATDVKLHLYGKVEARPGRKMGHVTAFGSSINDADRNVREARDSLLNK